MSFNTSRFARFGILGVWIALCCIGGTCGPAPSQNPTAGLSIESAAQAVREATDGFVAGGGESAAAKLESSISDLFASASDLDTALDAAESSLAGQINTAAEWQALQDYSVALNGRYVEDPVYQGVSRVLNEAGSPVPGCDTESETVVIFINGINNTKPEFLLSWAALGKFLREGPDGAKLKVDGYYNVSATDAEHSIFGGKICYLFGLTMKMLRNADVVDWCREKGGIVIDLLECAAQTANIKKWIASIPPVYDAERFSTFIRAQIDQGRKVIIVAHSQGNLMTSQALGFLTAGDGNQVPADPISSPLDSVGVVSVGSPTNIFPSRADRVYPVMVRGEIMDKVFTSWPANVDPPSEDMEATERHNFNDSYLRSGVARQLIRQAVSELDCNLSNPRGKFKITGTVTDAKTGSSIEGALVNFFPAGSGATSAADFTTDAAGDFGPYVFHHKDLTFPQVEIDVHKGGYTDKSVTRVFDRAQYGSDWVAIALDPEPDPTNNDGNNGGGDYCGAGPVEVTITGSADLEVGGTASYSAEAQGVAWYDAQFTWDLLGSSATLQTTDGYSTTVTATAAGTATLLVEVRDTVYGCILGTATMSIGVTTPPGYSVYLVQQICSDGQLEAFREDDAEAGIPLCQLGGGGLDCTIMATLTAVTGTYPTFEEAVAAICPRVTKTWNHYWAGLMATFDGLDRCTGNVGGELVKCVPITE